MKFAITLIPSLLASIALAQSDISADHKFAWGENIGWTNWRDADGGGVNFRNTFLFGSIWAENIGWINLGDGTPANGEFYQNDDGSDFGVNIDANDSEFSGFAWSENAGWINFDGGDLADPPRVARLDRAARRLRGYVWGENIGWINLDDAIHYIGLACAADFNGDGTTNLFDFLAFQTAFGNEDFHADLAAPFGVLNLFDFLAFQTAFGNGCG